MRARVVEDAGLVPESEFQLQAAYSPSALPTPVAAGRPLWTRLGPGATPRLPPPPLLPAVPWEVLLWVCRGRSAFWGKDSLASSLGSL